MTPQQLQQLVQAAEQAGASVAKAIRSAEIVVEDHLADLCGGTPRCHHYGLAAGCPPNVAGPTGFKNWRKKSKYAIAVRIDVPTAIMFSDQRNEIMQLLHEIVAGVEEMASDMGYPGTKSFAGGSCKQLFCREHAVCGVLSGQGRCRNPQVARPSMSGFGIDVARLMQTAGWPAKKAESEFASDAESMTWVAGLILIAEDGDRPR